MCLMSRKFALLGGSLGHTMSPPIHKALFDLRRREFEYDVIESEDISKVQGRLSELRGYNITIPHKVGIIEFIDEMDVTAERYNSVNCVDLKNGKRTGYNTDCVGFLETIRAMDAKLGGKVLLIGCGGVGRMMAIESALAGAELTVAVLESDMPLAKKAAENIKNMKPDANVNIVLNTEIDATKNYDLLMNACPVGMYPKTDGCPVGEEVIKAADAVFDVIYNPGETQLLKKAKALGKKCQGGMAMLVWQAVKAHEIWDGDEYSDEEVAKIIDEMQKIVDEKFKR